MSAAASNVETFDYIVVGAGTAGCVVASRLAEGDDRTGAGARSVLLLEAGGTDRRPSIMVPIGYGMSFTNPAVNWMYEGEPDPTLDGRRAYIPRGKVLGGSGSINALVYIRGQPRDFDDWCALGNPGWSWADVQPVFARVEQRIRLTDISAEAHPLTRDWLASCRQLGFAVTDDFNGPAGEGVGVYRFATHRGLRESTAGRYLHPALRRAGKRLRLRLHAQALRILFEQRRAVGLLYREGGRTLEARARRAVVLCAGSINTPQLLQLSGVGPAALLSRHAVPVVLDAPAVGQHLQDHHAVSYFYRSRIPSLNNVLYPLLGQIRIVLRYLATRGGPLGQSVNQGGGFVRSDPSQPYPNLQLYFNPLSYTTSPGPGRRMLKPDPFPAFLICFNSCRPTSRGHLEIRSSDPLTPPAIFANALATEHDIAEAIAGTRLLREMAATRPLADDIIEEFRPGPQVQSDAERLADFRQRAGTVFHPVSTCRMGPDPAQAVVDARLRVHGIEGLRIIDASVFPTVTSGNTNAPTIMIAEKGSAMLAEDAG